MLGVADLSDMNMIIFTLVILVDWHLIEGASWENPHQEPLNYSHISAKWIVLIDFGLYVIALHL